MAQRLATGATNIAVAGSTFAHGLAGTPTEFVAQKMDGGTGQTYFVGVSSTNVVVAANGAACSANVQCSIPWSAIQ